LKFTQYSPPNLKCSQTASNSPPSTTPSTLSIDTLYVSISQLDQVLPRLVLHPNSQIKQLKNLFRPLLWIWQWCMKTIVWKFCGDDH